LGKSSSREVSDLEFSPDSRTLVAYSRLTQPTQVWIWEIQY
jgi:WD40 repeat protein